MGQKETEMYAKGFKKGWDKAEARVIKILDEMDINLLLTDLVDITTGKIMEIPKELGMVLDLHWNHIRKTIKEEMNKQD